MARILIVEDEIVSAESIQQFLQSSEHQIVANVNSGAEAIAVATANRPDLVLMDIFLPGSIDGITAANQITSQLGIPVIYLSASTDDEVTQRAIATQPFGYLVKPFDRAQLLIAIDIALRRYSLEQQLTRTEQWLATVLLSIGDGTIATDREGRITFMNPIAAEITGWQAAEAIGQPIHRVLDLMNAETREPIENPLVQAIQRGQPMTLPDQCLLRTRWGDERAVGDTASPIRNSQGETIGGVLIFQDITLRRQAEAAFRRQAERERVLLQITQRIRQSLDLAAVLNSTTAEVRQWLQVDRVVIYRFDEDWSGMVIAESVAPGWTALLGRRISDPCLSPAQCVLPYLQGYIGNTPDIYQAGFSECYVNLLEQYQIHANLVIPILQGKVLWGLLAAQHCASPRQWLPEEVDLLVHLAGQLAIAIQQSQLYQQVRQLNTDLEEQIQERTVQLQQAYNFEATLKRITDRVRDSLDEAQILQVAVSELVRVLEIHTCNAALYDLERQTSTICYESTTSTTPFQTYTIEMGLFPEGYQQLLQGQHFQFCPLPPVSGTGSETSQPAVPEQMVKLACPLQDDQGVLGDLWLMHHASFSFSERDIRLVEQVANQCAIAIRQSRLFQEAQRQVTELERLNQLKDDFLSTISHELLTPMSNIRMAIQMIEIVLGRLHDFTDPSVERYFEILRSECQRETKLINDLLEITRLDAETATIELQSVNLANYLPQVVAPFRIRIENQNQQLQMQIAEDLPPLLTNLSHLSRILSELLDNACKYSPAGATITVFARSTLGEVAIGVQNTGVEIPAVELPRIFNRFYRIPTSNPWRHGGTGLGLALVQKRVIQLGGTIQAQSQNNVTTLTLRLPR